MHRGGTLISIRWRDEFGDRWVTTLELVPEPYLLMGPPPRKLRCVRGVMLASVLWREADAHARGMVAS